MVLTYTDRSGSIDHKLEDERDMKTYERTFTNPLLALAFTDGVSFANPNYICKQPDRKGENKWVVEIEEYEEDETITKEPVVNVPDYDALLDKTLEVSNKPKIINDDITKYFTRTKSSETKRGKYVPPDKTIDALASSLPPPKKIKVAGEVDDDEVVVSEDDSAKQSIDQWLKDRAAENELSEKDIIDMRDFDDNESMPLVGLGGLSTWPCGICLGCAADDTCIAQVNDACLSQNMIANLTK